MIETALALAKGQKSQSRVLKPDEAPLLMAAMRSKCPLPGPSYKEAYVVVIPPGTESTLHEHDEYVVMFYAEPANTPIIVEGNAFMPKAGDFYVLPPNKKHEVPINASDTIRVSIAMKVA